MGCGYSRLDEGDEKHHGHLLIQEKMEDIEREKRVRNAGIASKPELLRPNDRKGVKDDVEIAVNIGVEVIATVIEEKKKENMKEGIVGALIKKDEPGSPSFRVFLKRVSSNIREEMAISFDDDSDKIIQKIEEGRQVAQDKKTQVMEAKRSTTDHGRENSFDSFMSNEDSTKNHLKDKKKKFGHSMLKAFAKH